MKQTIMLGFSDGTKDGGYFMANWSIYLAKESLSKLSNEFGVRVAFFDGRGGPPARGGGNTHEFYASMGDTSGSGMMYFLFLNLSILPAVSTNFDFPV